MLATLGKHSAAILLAISGSVIVACWFAPVVKGRFQSQAESSFVIERGRAGRFEVGMTVDEVVTLVGHDNIRLVATFPAGSFQPELEILLLGHKLGFALSAPIFEGPCGEYALWGISVYDPRFRTRDGWGVGSTLSDLKKRYPTAEVGNIGTHGLPSVYLEDLYLTFQFAGPPPFANDARVTSVWVVPQDTSWVRARRCPGRTQ